MDVLVAGGTGFIGTSLCRELDERDLDVTAFARDPTGATLPESITRVEGDVRSQDDLEEALEGTDVVVNLVALSPLRIPPGGEGMHEKVHTVGTENIVEAAESRAVDRVVQMSALGAELAAPTRYLQSKGRAEEIVRDATIPATVFRPSVVFGDGGEFVSFTRKLSPPILAPLPGGGKTKFQPIWIEDFVAMIADAVTEDDHADETYEIGGPEVLTLREVAKLSRRALGQKTRIVPIPMGLAGVGMSIMGRLPGFPFGSDQYRSLKMDNVVSENDITAFGVSEEDLRTLREHLGLARPGEEADRVSP
jgi:uncharacterized protein YbjT (DUF2867 family)